MLLHLLIFPLLPLFVTRITVTVSYSHSSHFRLHPDICWPIDSACHPSDTYSLSQDGSLLGQVSRNLTPSITRTRAADLYASTPRTSLGSSPPTSTSMSFRYYQPPKSKRPVSESEDESSEEEQPRNSRKSSNANASHKRFVF